MARATLSTRRWALGLVALVALGCTPSAPTIFVQVELGAGLPSVDQLSFKVSKTGQPTLGPQLRPEVAGSTLALEQSVRLALPDGYLGTVTVQVDALSGGNPVGTGSADALVRAGAESTVVVSIEPGLACDATTCPNGCCAAGICIVNSLNLCGTAGGSCSACDPSSSDRCDNGVCRCGTGTECLTGQTCTGGGCKCDQFTCPGGCCSGNACLAGDTNAQCGVGGGQCSACAGSDTCTEGVCPSCSSGCDAGCCSGSTCNPSGVLNCGVAGAACLACDPIRTDRCTAGSCACGTGPACGAGQICAGGVCTCNSSSCPRGCCQAGQCQTGLSTACGSDGGTCSACNLATADRCSLTGQCACGGSAPCASPATCTGGQCRCDGGTCASTCNATTCPNGCCNAGQCIPSALATCGVGGAACIDCSVRGSSCSGGVCTCKNIAACPLGTKCSTMGQGSCKCDTSSGCVGCCSGGNCVNPTTPLQCGASGGNCSACNATTANVCTNGSCRCGAGAGACPAGKYCDAGTCL